MLAIRCLDLVLYDLYDLRLRLNISGLFSHLESELGL